MGLYILIAAAFVFVCLYVIIHVIESRDSKKKDTPIIADTPKPVSKSFEEIISANIELGKKMQYKAHRSLGVPPSRFASDPYVSAHGIIWNTSDDPVNQGFMGTETNFEGFGNGGSFGGGGASGSYDSDSGSSSSDD